MFQPSFVARAFVNDQSNVIPCRVARLEGSVLVLVDLVGVEFRVSIADAAGMGAVLDEPTSTLLDGSRLALVNQNCQLLGLAFGPPTPPGRLEVVVVIALEDGSVPAHGDQPGWRLFSVSAAP